MADEIDAGALYRELAPAVLGYLRSERVPDPEDVLGEVFLQVARDLRRRRFRGDDAALRRWVFSIAHNRIVDAHRRRTRDRSEPAAEAVEGTGGLRTAGGPPDPFDQDLVEALGSLSDDQREVVVLRFVADLSIEQVATITGRTAGAVKALQHRGLDNLRRNLGTS
ncbi:MAG TPA: sigma-70 family RNA polymerase sigma factor [Acidimicrobiales bacterium]|nr:sigma-70 family RNA polymerase sigma factor [Acidimicrobiales bacterium]